MDLWMTSDQQGRFYLEKGDYEKAAARFEDLAWKAVAYYLNENFDIAVELFARIETADGFFNLGNAYAHSQNYLLARDAYTKVLRLNPQHEGAARNRKIVQDIIDDINRMSESQQAEMGEQSKELSENDPKRAEGAERKDMVPQEAEQLSAEQILKDQKLNDIWMRQVQPDPAQFLSAKFFMQLERKKASKEEEQ
jgi:Ca-activated chloride channel family protein